MGPGLPAASAASGPWPGPLQPGILAAKFRDRQIAGQATAAKPGGVRTAKPQASLGLVSRGQPCALRGSLLSFFSASERR